MEMWSPAPIYHFLREFKNLRQAPLVSQTLQKMFDNYKNYFANIKPMLEDILKHFNQTSQKLKELVEENTSLQKNDRQ